MIGTEIQEMGVVARVKLRLDGTARTFLLVLKFVKMEELSEVRSVMLGLKEDVLRIA